MTGLTFAKFFAADWRGGTLYQLTVDEEGMYIRSCAYMWDTGECIPGDDRLASRLLNVQIQKYQKLMGALIEKGKMTRGQGVIFNERVLEEISSYQRHSEAQASRAKKGHTTRKLTASAVKELMEEIERLKEELAKREQPPHQPPEVPPEVRGGGSLGGTPEVPQGVSGKKHNEINEGEQNGQNSGTTEARSLEARSKNKNSYTPKAPSVEAPCVGDGPRPGEEVLPHGVFVNCQTVRHRAFSISIEAIAMQLATASGLGLTIAEAREHAKNGAISHALDWAVQIEDGKLSEAVVPKHIANFIRGSVASQLTKSTYGGRRIDGLKQSKQPTETPEQRKKRLFQEAQEEMRGRR